MELENTMKQLLRLLVAIAIVLPYVKANESGMCKLTTIHLFNPYEVSPLSWLNTLICY